MLHRDVTDLRFLLDSVSLIPRCAHWDVTDLLIEMSLAWKWGGGRLSPSARRRLRTRWGCPDRPASQDRLRGGESCSRPANTRTRARRDGSATAQVVAEPRPLLHRPGWDPAD